MMRYVSITSPDINNGEGFRVTLWVAGCPHHCPGCHNPQTWDYNQGMTIDEIRDDLYYRLSKPYIKGLTLSGGDPLGQSDDNLAELLELIKDIKKEFPSKDIWIFSGYTYEDAVKNPARKKILDECDCMVDGPFIQSMRDTSIPFRGSRNQRIIRLKR